MEWSRLLEEMNMVVSGSWDRTLRHWATTCFFSSRFPGVFLRWELQGFWRRFVLVLFFLTWYLCTLGSTQNKKLLYFEWSPPWHVGWRLSGEGCHWEYDGKNGEFENIDFRFPWLSDTSEMGFGHDVPFLNYSDRLPHPSDLCQPDRVRWG